MGAAASLAPGMEQSVELSDPLATPDVDRYSRRLFFTRMFSP